MKISRRNKKRIKNFTQEVLYKLRELGELALEIMPEPFEGKYAHIRRLRNYSEGREYKTLWDLEYKGWVKKEKHGRKIVYQLTNLGRAKSLKTYYQKKAKIRRTDGFSTIVIFDIPESKKKARDFLRRFLLQNGFILLQKSVLIGPFNLHRGEFDELLQELGIRQYVSIVDGKLVNWL